jgi:Tol biopolymer transport system component
VAASPVTDRASVGPAGAQGTARSGSPALSANGRYAAFISDAPNLVTGDTNGSNDVFVRDTAARTTARVSIASDGSEANSGSDEWDAPSISADGRYVAFTSNASNLVPGVANGVTNVFVRDLAAGVTTCVSLDSGGAPGNDNSFAPSISADGRYVAFASNASNLVSGDTNAASDVFVRDTQTGVTRRVSVAPDGTEGNGPSGYPCISANAKFVAFASAASNLSPNDANDAADIFVCDLQSGSVSLASTASDGTPGNDWSDYTPSLSADGRYVAFLSNASNLVAADTNGSADVFVHDMQSGWTVLASADSSGTIGNDASFSPCLSADARYVAFASLASNLTAGDVNGAADLFIRDLWLGRTALASLDSASAQGNGWSGPMYPPSLSGDGSSVAFESWASNLVAADTNGAGDVFVRSALFAAPPFTTGDKLGTLRAAGGLDVLTGAQLTRLNVVTTGSSFSVVDILDAVRVARKAAGLEP